MRDIIEQISLFTVAGASILISVFDLFGLFEGIPFLEDHSAKFSLLVLGIVVGYLALERRGKLDKIERLATEGFEKTFLSIGRDPVRRLWDTQEVYEYVAQRMKEAKTKVDDLSWGRPISTRITEAQERAFQKYVEMVAITSSRSEISYREVMSFPDEERLLRAERILAKNIYAYQLRYFEIDPTNAPPVIEFMVIDSQEVIVAFYKGVRESGIHFATRQPLIVRFFQDYYEAIWREAKVLKEAGQEPNDAALQYIRQLLKP